MSYSNRHQAPTDEILVAYADGELGDAEMRAVEAAVAADPQLRDRLRALVAAAVLAGEALNAAEQDGLLDDEVSGVAEAEVRDTAAAPDPAQADTTRRILPFRRRRDQNRTSAGAASPLQFRAPAMALAASLALVAGLGLGHWTAGPAADLTAPPLLPPVPGPVAEVLESQPSFEMVTTGIGTVMVRASFEHTNGEFCRDYEVLTDDSALHAVACRADDGDWQVRLAAPLPAADQAAPGTVQPAGGDDAAFEAAIDAMRGDGDLMDPDAEAEFLTIPIRINQAAVGDPKLVRGGDKGAIDVHGGRALDSRYEEPWSVDPAMPAATVLPAGETRQDGPEIGAAVAAERPDLGREQALPQQRQAEAKPHRRGGGDSQADHRAGLACSSSVSRHRLRPT